MNAKDLIDSIAVDIECLPMGRISISTPDGKEEIDALLLGDWALNQNKDGWAATHRKSGYAGKSFTTVVEALISLGVFLGAGMTALPDEFTKESFQEIPGIRDIAGRVKAALAILDGWDLDLDYNEPDYAEDVP